MREPVGGLLVGAGPAMANSLAAKGNEQQTRWAAKGLERGWAATMVLTKPEGARPGTKGLSVFYVPKYLFDRETLEIGPRNGVFATGLEHKTGLKSSPTSELTFGAHGIPAVGYLVGDVHNGIAQMFTLIEHARSIDDLFLPAVKGFGSERAYEILTESLETFGGSGFLQDYPVEQYIRDAKIDSLNEGTTAMQAMEFFFRKIMRDKG